MKRCFKCDMYFDNISDRLEYFDRSITIIHSGKTFLVKEEDFCYDCLRKNDLLYKCSICNQIKESLAFMEKKTFRIHDGYWYLGKIQLNVLDFGDQYWHLGKIKLNVPDFGDQYICDKKVKFGTYCLDCADQLTHGISELYDNININYIDKFKHLGYSFKNDEELIQTGKSLQHSGSPINKYRIKIEKCKRRKWKKIPKGYIKEEQQKIREFFY